MKSFGNPIMQIIKQIQMICFFGICFSGPSPGKPGEGLLPINNKAMGGEKLGDEFSTIDLPIYVCFYFYVISS